MRRVATFPTDVRTGRHRSGLIQTGERQWLKSAAPADSIARKSETQTCHMLQQMRNDVGLMPQACTRQN
jgi:hypothetical protein